MCGRYRLTRADIGYLREYFGVEDLRDLPSETWISYNIAPQTFHPVVRLSPETGKREFALLLWGLVPFNSKKAKVNFSNINARAENLLESRVFAVPFKMRRCLVVALGNTSLLPVKGKTPAMNRGFPVAIRFNIYVPALAVFSL